MEEEGRSFRGQNDRVRGECGNGECLVGREGLRGGCEGGANFYFSVENYVEGPLGLGRGEGEKAVYRNGSDGVRGVGGTGEEGVIEGGVG